MHLNIGHKFIQSCEWKSDRLMQRIVALQMTNEFVSVHFQFFDSICVTECLTSDIFSMLLCGVSDCIYLYLV